MNSTVKISIFFALYLSLTGCGEPNATVWPNDILPPDSMTLIMTDIHLVEGAKLGRKVMGDTVPITDYFEAVYKKYKLTKADFDRSFDYYSAHPKEMEKVYEAVIEKLNAMEIAVPKWEENGGESTQSESIVQKIDSLKAQKDSSKTNNNVLKINKNL